ncbi:MAG: hypothetical protein R2713_12665 [Ilumatobacteraceae bacterium]|nr:hypothetical protein [Acidimicrobiales bacterium]MCB9392940.1 hypothetical protein [Acidimicrobiaceae bacterium]
MTTEPRPDTPPAADDTAPELPAPDPIEEEIAQIDARDPDAAEQVEEVVDEAAAERPT